MVFVEGCATPACKHESLDSAEKEAKRLATLLKKKAYVLCTIKSVEDTQYKIEDCRPGGSDLPFLIGTVMKQTVEEAAISSQCEMGCQDCPNHAQAYDGYYSSKNVKCPFILGVEWQSKQSPWISVKEKAGCDTSDDCIVMVMNGDIFKAYFSSKNKWMKSNGGYYDEVIDDVVAWMPIPSFDDILEENRDVLERIKEKGD